jgi:Spy/CpxP family protein refolding chaperone
MRIIVAVPFAIVLAAPVFAASDRPNRPYDDGSSVWDQLGRDFEDFGNKLRERFGGSFPFGMRGGESRGERPVISYMLSHREELKLTPEQVKKLEDLKTGFERSARKNQEDLRAAEKSLEELTRSDSIDLKQAEAKVREVERLRADQRIARIRAVEQGKSVLSQEQRERLRDMMEGRNRYTGRPEDRDRRTDSDRGQRKQRGDQSQQSESF